MSITKTLLGASVQVPERPEKGWGPSGTGILVALIDAVSEAVFRVAGTFGVKRDSASVALAAASTLTPTAPVMKITGTPGAVTIADIAVGVEDGQLLDLLGGANAVTIPSAGNVSLNGNCVLELNEFLLLRWDDALALWIERARSN